LYYLNGRDGFPSDNVVSPRVQLTQLSTTVQNKGTQNVESAAVYGNVDYDFTDRSHLSLGARYTREDIGIEMDQTIVNDTLPLLAVVGQPIVFPLLNTPLAVGTAQAIAAMSGGALAFVPGSSVTTTTTAQPSTRYTSFTPNVKLAFDLSSVTMIYTGFAEGYKAGGFDTFRPFTRFEPEKVQAYTLGLKHTALEGRLRFNSEAFYNDYSDKQLSTVELIGNELGKITRNAGSVTTYGMDFDAAWLTSIRGLTLGLTGGYLQTKVEHFFQASSTGQILDTATVTRLGFSPKWTGAATATYTMPLASSGSMTLASSVAYRSQSYTDTPIDECRGGFGSTRRSRHHQCIGDVQIDG
jgi:iron complex outermembrane receptor protein